MGYYSIAIKQMRFVGMYRIKNEAEWIEEVIESALPLCEHIYILDDHSDDKTVEICCGFPEDRVTVYCSTFEGLDETRDKNWLYEEVLSHYPPNEHGQTWPDWICCIDGDEVFSKEAPGIIREQAARTKAPALSLRIHYLWNKPNQIRVDGVYRNYCRPSVFKVINPAYRWQPTPWGGNLHCSSIPQEFVGQAETSEAVLLHYGYMTREKRLQKWDWYNTVDPDNPQEDNYLHMLIGDIEDLPANSKRLHAGPLELRMIDGT